MLLVAMRFGETPVHIPNTMVKTKAADDTMLETAWESRWLPDLLKDKTERFYQRLEVLNKSLRFLVTDKRISQKCTLKTSYIVLMKKI